MRGSDNNDMGTPKSVRVWFGIFMILVYLGVGLLFILDIFNIDNTAISCTVGGILIAYGIWLISSMLKAFTGLSLLVISATASTAIQLVRTTLLCLPFIYLICSGVSS